MDKPIETATNTSRSPARRGWGAEVFSFPDPINEVSARLVAGRVVLMSLVTIALGVPWLTGLMRLGVIPEEVCERCNNIVRDRRELNPTMN
jgi:hypothetical protein